jgi:phosphate/sulfate permease
MQFRGGYRYPDLTPALALAALLLAGAVLIGAWYAGCPMSVLQSAGLICGLLGTALLSSAFTPVGLVPP